MTLSWNEVTEGTIVRIRSVEDMIAEFDEDDDGDPRIETGWDHRMGIACGLTCRVVDRFRRDYYTILILQPEDDCDPLWTAGDPSPLSALTRFTWSTEMAELVTPVEAIVVEHPEVSALLRLLGPPPASAITAHHAELEQLQRKPSLLHPLPRPTPDWVTLMNWNTVWS